MSTLGTLKAEIAGLFTLGVADFTVNGKDLLTAAINNAVRKAQELHDFERTKVLTDLVVDGAAGGNYVTGLKLHGTATAVELMRIIDIGPYDSDNVGLIPKTWMTYDEYKTRQRSSSGWEYDPEFRYPANERPDVTEVQYVLVGEVLKQVPTGTAGETSTVGLYGIKLHAAYAEGAGGDGTEDMFLKFGHDYVMWEAALNLNYLKQEWVLRQEGTLGPPKSMRDEAWGAFTLWDSYQYNKFPEGGL